MPLRCLLFSSSQELVQPIWQVLADLGIEGEYCQSAVDAVERVTTQLFQIVITDWEDQPEAAFLLKTARDLKAAHRPLILAIVGDDAGLPEALRAGANSVLVKPIRAEQARDTLSTACELLRSKFQSSTTPAAPVTAPEQKPEQKPEQRRELQQEQQKDTAEIAAAAAAGAVSASSSVGQVPEKTFRAGEFLTSASSAPGAQFDTEPENDVQKSLDQAAISEVDALTDLEPMASAVQDAQDAPAEPAPTQTALTGWAALQARLTQPITLPARQAATEEAPAKSELLAYGETPSYGAPVAEPPAKQNEPAKTEAQGESAAESALFAYMPGENEDGAQPEARPESRHSKVILLSAFALACAVLIAVPRTRASLQMVSRYAVRAAANWLNPPPAPLPQPIPLHDSFGQSGDEYKLPAAENIPDATTDASQIRVLPVVDPTAKPEKPPEADSGQAQATTGEKSVADHNQSDQNQTGQTPAAQNQTAQNQTGQNQTGQNQTGQNQTGQNQTGQDQSGQTQAAKDPIKDSATSVAVAPGSAAGVSPAAAPAPMPEQPNVPVVRAVAPQPRLVTSTVPSVAPPHPLSAGSVGIPSSLKSQMASSTPDASGSKPPEAAMSAIEPVSLTESAARDLLDHPVDPTYPTAAKATEQRGSVVLQVQIGRDGAVQEVKFMQGSLVFARAAIDAVRQWQFKPYFMNGRAVSVKSLITLNFKPPA
jgi:TonB family protein